MEESLSAPEAPWIWSMRALKDWKSSGAAAEGGEGILRRATGLRRICCFEPDAVVVRVGVVRAFEPAGLVAAAGGVVVSWVWVGVVRFGWRRAWLSSWSGEGWVADCALRVSAPVMARSRVVPVRLDTAAGDVGGISGVGSPRSCSNVV